MRFPCKSGASSVSGFSLAEVVVATALTTLVFAGVICGYVQTSDRAEWSSYSLAAQSLAMQAIEQARAAKWDPNAWPPLDELGVTNYTAIEPLDVPVAGSPIYATNYVTVSQVSSNPPLRELRAECIWELPSRGTGNRGPFTNVAITLRASDQ